jgi:para-nitrobenzyl esterase
VAASHLLELPYLFEVDYLDPATQTRLRDAMIDYWAAFVHGGDPGVRGLPRWPAFQQGEYVQSLASGRAGIHRTDFPADHDYEFWHRLAR